MDFRRRAALLLALLLACPQPTTAQDRDAPLRLAVPQAMIDSGFTTHILPRFRFRHRIALAPVPQGTPADMALTADNGPGAPVFRSLAGEEFRLTATGSAHAEAVATFRDWLTSPTGRAAVEGFPPGGPPVYTTAASATRQTAPTGVEGDASAGSRLAIVHCGRCHVVDQRNRMGGIGSTPSFRALRARPGWTDLFLAFWSENPHPSFTQVTGVTDPFDPARPPHIAPVTVTLDDIAAITAFVGTLEPKDLGAPVPGQ